MTVIQAPFAADTIRDAVMQALGAASTCWEDLSGTGVFQSARAQEIGERLLEFIDAKVMLGVATTRQLIAELAARADIAATIGETWPLYRTVEQQ